MRKHGVALKLFVVTSALIAIVFSLAMLAEGLFFERFYRTSKIQTLERNMEAFADLVGAAGGDGRRTERLLGAFMNENDASASVLNREFRRVPMNPYYLRLQAEGKAVTVVIPTEGMKIGDIPRGLRVGDSLVVDGFYMDEKDTVMQPVDIGTTSPTPEEGLARVRGTITDLLLPERRSFNPLYQDTLVDDALSDWIPLAGRYGDALRSGSTVQSEWTDEWSGVRYALLVRKLPEENGGERYLFSLTSLQPVGEAVRAMHRYFAYLAPILIGLSIVLSLIYARIVSRPLVALNRSAARLARLDFAESEKSEIRTKDEFGELSGHLVELSRNLDAALKELTRANAKLQEDVAEKEKAERLRKELIANLSHELKTPLGIVKGYAEGLQDGVAGDKRDLYLAHIAGETDRMNALIMDMLELSQYEVNAVRLKPVGFSMARLIRKAIGSFSLQAESKGVRLVLAPDEGDEPLVHADPKRIEQVVLNIMSNAIRHADKNSEVKIAVRRAGTGKVETVIENAGSPIAEEDLTRIWEPFYRAERSRDRKSGGTGLGLAIVQRALELHGGEYGAANTERGVAFAFTLDEYNNNENENGDDPHES